jgi:hypothetical protein
MILRSGPLLGPNSIIPGLPEANAACKKEIGPRGRLFPRLKIFLINFRARSTSVRAGRRSASVQHGQRFTYTGRSRRSVTRTYFPCQVGTAKAAADRRPAHIKKISGGTGARRDAPGALIFERAY